MKNDPLDNLVYLQKFVSNMKKEGMWNEPQGLNLLDGGAPFYSIYQSKDKKNFAVACIEPKFFSEFIKVIIVYLKFVSCLLGTRRR